MLKQEDQVELLDKATTKALKQVEKERKGKNVILLLNGLGTLSL